jgi:hypothetical protein
MSVQDAWIMGGKQTTVAAVAMALAESGLAMAFFVISKSPQHGSKHPYKRMVPFSTISSRRLTCPSKYTSRAADSLHIYSCRTSGARKHFSCQGF